MKPYYADDAVTLYHGDCLDVLREIPDASIDAVCTDPPYGLEFMGKDWDAPWKSSSVGRGVNVAAERSKEITNQGKGHSTSAGPYLAARVDSVRVAGLPFQRWCEQWATECLRVLKPGGHMVAFGGSRTWHRLAVAVEDAGFEIRDSIAWLYGSGFPKSLDVSKAIDKAAGAEREVTRHALVADDTRPIHVDFDPRASQDRERRDFPATPDAQRWQGWGTALKPAFEPIVVGRKPLTGTVAANVLEHGTGALNVDGCRVGTSETLGRAKGGWGNAAVGAGGYGEFDSRGITVEGGRWPTNVVLDASQAAKLDAESGVSAPKAERSGRRGGDGNNGTLRGPGGGTPDSIGTWPADPGGGASRFFPTFHYEAKAPQHERPRDGETAHPTVKPLDLMRWLVRLVTPPCGTVLEPFAGSGTTAEACVVEGFKCIAIEREASYLPLIVQRLSKPIQVGLDFGEATA